VSFAVRGHAWARPDPALPAFVRLPRAARAA
jgi:hypothetical protein